jgi:profilin
MEAYKPYIDYILNGKVAETAYILSHQGVICGTNLPIKELPRYEIEVPDANDPNKKNKIVMDERANLLDALAHKGVSSHPAGIRLYNQKYYTVHYDFDEKNPKSIKTLYLKKDKGGACICVTKNFIIIGTFCIEHKMANDLPQGPGELNKRVETLAKDLFSKGS